MCPTSSELVRQAEKHASACCFGALCNARRALERHGLAEVEASARLLAYGDAYERGEHEYDDAHEPAAHAHLDAHDHSTPLRAQTPLVIVVVRVVVLNVYSLVSSSYFDEEHDGQVNEKGEHAHAGEYEAAVALERRPVHVLDEHEALEGDERLDHRAYGDHRASHIGVHVDLVDVGRIGVRQRLALGDEDERADEREQEMEHALGEHVLVDGHLRAQAEEHAYAQAVGERREESEQRHDHCPPHGVRHLDHRSTAAAAAAAAAARRIHCVFILNKTTAFLLYLYAFFFFFSSLSLFLVFLMFVFCVYVIASCARARLLAKPCKELVFK